MSEDKEQAIEDGNIIEISKDLLYQTWIDQPMYFTNILYFTLIKDQEKEVERFRLFQVLEKISSALVNSVHEKEICLQIELGKFRYDLVIFLRVDAHQNPYLLVGFPEDFELDSEPVYRDVEQVHSDPVIKKSRIIEDHLFSYFRGLYLEDQETAIKLYHCTGKDFYRRSIVTEYEPGKRFYYAEVMTSILPNSDRTLHLTDYRSIYLQVTPSNIIYKRSYLEKRRQVPYYMLHKVLEDLPEEDRPTLEDLFDIYDPRLKFMLKFPTEVKYPSKMVLKKRRLYTAEDMAGYILKGIEKNKAAKLLLNLSSDSPSRIIAAIRSAIRVSKKPDDLADRLLNQEAPYNIDPLLKAPYGKGIVLANRLGYQVDWQWPLDVWVQQTNEWEKEEEEILTLLPDETLNKLWDARGTLESVNIYDISCFGG